jgi:hypothetical protein
MIPQVKWWRAKSAPPQTASRAEWFDENTAFPGFVVTIDKCKGNVRLFRDLAAFRTHDGTFSIDLAQKWLEEVAAPDIGVTATSASEAPPLAKEALAALQGET